MIQGHGGNIYELARDLGCLPEDIVDLSSNVNPYGPPPGLLDFLKKQMSVITALPEVDAAGIRETFADRHNLDPKRVLAGNGTTQLIYSLPRSLAATNALVLAPAYADYADACVLHNVPCDFLITTAEDGFAYAPDRIVSAIADAKADLVFICNPNNPTGVLMAASDIVEICTACLDTTFIVDESYLPFVPHGENLSLVQQDRLGNLIVLNSMSKIFKIPGLRIGFVAAAPAIIERLENYVSPWSVNSLSQAAVSWLMREKTIVDKFIADTVAGLEEEKRFLKEQLANSALTLFDSTTSFILAQLKPPRKSEQVCDFLGQRRMLIRNCANFKGLSSSYIRISLKTRQDHTKLVEALLELGL